MCFNVLLTRLTHPSNPLNIAKKYWYMHDSLTSLFIYFIIAVLGARLKERCYKNSTSIYLPDNSIYFKNKSCWPSSRVISSFRNLSIPLFYVCQTCTNSHHHFIVEILSYHLFTNIVFRFVEWILFFLPFVSYMRQRSGDNIAQIEILASLTGFFKVFRRDFDRCVVVLASCLFDGSVSHDIYNSMETFKRYKKLSWLESSN